MWARQCTYRRDRLRVSHTKHPPQIPVGQVHQAGLIFHVLGDMCPCAAASGPLDERISLGRVFGKVVHHVDAAEVIFWGVLRYRQLGILAQELERFFRDDRVVWLRQPFAEFKTVGSVGVVVVIDAQG